MVRRDEILRMVRSNETRDRDRPVPCHSSLAASKGRQPSRRDAALKLVGPQGQPMEVREPPRTVREEPMNLGKERARLRGEPARWQEQRTAATGPRPEETGLGRAASGAPSSPWVAARSAH